MSRRVKRDFGVYNSALERAMDVVRDETRKDRSKYIQVYSRKDRLTRVTGLPDNSLFSVLYEHFLRGTISIRSLKTFLTLFKGKKDPIWLLKVKSYQYDALSKSDKEAISQVQLASLKTVLREVLIRDEDYKTKVKELMWHHSILG